MLERRPDQVSIGQAQRAGIMRALIASPPLVLFDEPLSALDAVTQKHTARLIAQLQREEGFAALIVTHDLGYAAAFGDEIAVRDARLYGPALGMTGDGDINLDLRVMDFDGTLVPSYTANSLLGGIPVLGDLFTSEKKGGLIALTYTVSGPFEQTQIAINPLSALTPGFLRGIFKNERDALPESEREKIEDIAPPPQPRE